MVCHGASPVVEESIRAGNNKACATSPYHVFDGQSDVVGAVPSGCVTINSVHPLSPAATASAERVRGC